MTEEGLGVASASPPQPEAGVAATPSGHTPGPWRVGQEFSDCLSAVESDAGDIGYFTLRSPQERRANARLIAAAPDLLDALKAIDALEVMEINPSNYDHEIVCELNANAVQAALIARAAIAKAEGRP